jgi:hypothetical protein
MAGQDQHKSLEEVDNVAVPRWVTPDLIRQTITVWEPRYGRPLSTDEAVQIILTAGRLCEVLKP